MITQRPFEYSGRAHLVSSTFLLDHRSAHSCCSALSLSALAVCLRSLSVCARCLSALAVCARSLSVRARCLRALAVCARSLSARARCLRALAVCARALSARARCLRARAVCALVRAVRFVLCLARFFQWSEQVSSVTLETKGRRKTG